MYVNRLVGVLSEVFKSVFLLFSKTLTCWIVCGFLKWSSFQACYSEVVGWEKWKSVSNTLFARKGPLLTTGVLPEGVFFSSQQHPTVSLSSFFSCWRYHCLLFLLPFEGCSDQNTFFSTSIHIAYYFMTNYLVVRKMFQPLPAIPHTQTHMRKRSYNAH